MRVAACDGNAQLLDAEPSTHVGWKKFASGGSQRCRGCAECAARHGGSRDFGGGCGRKKVRSRVLTDLVSAVRCAAPLSETLLGWKAGPSPLPPRSLTVCAG